MLRFLLSFLALLPVAAQATRPMTTDDATVLDPGFCQVESWAQRGTAQVEYWVLPACSVAPGWELAAGGATVRARRDGSNGYESLLQLKTVFQPLPPDGWAAGLSLGTQFNHHTQTPSQLQLNVPLTLSLGGGATLLHANAGVARDRISRKTDPSWALGCEFNLTQQTALTLEGFGSKYTHSYLQIGAHHTVIADTLDLDITYGERMRVRGMERFAAIGLTFASRVFP